jgi:hypothetical protein
LGNTAFIYNRGADTLCTAACGVLSLRTAAASLVNIQEDTVTYHRNESMTMWAQFELAKGRSKYISTFFGLQQHYERIVLGNFKVTFTASFYKC